MGGEAQKKHPVQPKRESERAFKGNRSGSGSERPVTIKMGKAEKRQKQKKPKVGNGSEVKNVGGG